MDTKKYDVVIEISPKYIAEHSDPEEDRYVFVYYITIRNNGTITAQLISRHWLITDANGQVQEVQGQGVVGQQPTILPNKYHKYNSFYVLSTPVGCMEGSFQMVAEDGTSFEAPIAPFSLATPRTLN